MNPWTLESRGFDPAAAAREESLFSQGNGYIGWRGNYEEGYAAKLGLDGCYINAFHETEKIRYGEIAYGYAENSQTMLNVTSSQRILLAVNGTACHPDQSAENCRVLDMEHGAARRDTVYCVDGVRVSVHCERVVSMRRTHTAAIRMTVTADAPCTIRVTALLDGDVINLVCVDDPRVGSGLKGRVLSAPVTRTEGSAAAMAQVTGHTRLAEACGMAVSAEPALPTAITETGMRLESSWELPLSAGQSFRVTKCISYYDGKAGEEEILLAEALREAEDSLSCGFDALLREQEEYMASFWQKADLWFDGDDDLQQGLHFNLFHLLQSAGRNGRSNIAAKGLTGEGYEGHYFWDTETYIFPVFLHVAPEIARALLAYRYSILPLARERAREMGHPTGALFPWRTIDGHEASAYFPAGTAQYHINADIALAVKRYWEATGDDAFMWQMGAEMVCETARLYLDLGFYNPRKGNRFCINGVTGPDEYNAMVDNNAYTNIMAATNMHFAADVLREMARRAPEAYARLCGKIGLLPGEPEAWVEAADRIYIPRDEETGIICQDDGFMDRVPWPLDTIPKENHPLLLHYHGLVIYRHMVCKQADTVLAMLLLPDAFTREDKVKAFNFYEPVTTHDSSLSMAAYSAVASRIGRMDMAWDYFREAARLDLDDTHNNTRDGLHMANMAGTWVCLVSGFGGMKVTAEGIGFDPVLPEQLNGYGFSVEYKGRVIHVQVDRSGVRYSLTMGAPIDIMDRGTLLRLTK